MIMKLVYTELKSYKSKSNLKQFLIIFILMGFSLILLMSAIPKQLSENPIFIKIIDNILYFRVSLSLYIFIAWMFIAKSFYGKKKTGEIESIISIGYSAKNIWIAKSLATLLVTSICVIPTFILFIAGIKIYIFLKFKTVVLINLPGFLFLFIINPLILFFSVLIIGGVQLVTDDYMKSQLVLFLTGFINMYTISLFKNIYSTQGIIIYLNISLIILFIIGIANLFISKKINNENFIISLFNISKREGYYKIKTMK